VAAHAVTGRPKAGSGVSQAVLGTYKCRPLYCFGNPGFAGDSGAGKATGERFRAFGVGW
jgi:hypothetical protein